MSMVIHVLTVLPVPIQLHTTLNHVLYVTLVLINLTPVLPRVLFVSIGIPMLQLSRVKFFHPSHVINRHFNDDDHIR